MRCCPHEMHPAERAVRLSNINILTLYVSADRGLIECVTLIWAVRTYEDRALLHPGKRQGKCNRYDRPWYEEIKNHSKLKSLARWFWQCQKFVLTRPYGCGRRGQKATQFCCTARPGHRSAPPIPIGIDHYMISPGNEEHVGTNRPNPHSMCIYGKARPARSRVTSYN